MLDLDQTLKSDLKAQFLVFHRLLIINLHLFFFHLFQLDLNNDQGDKKRVNFPHPEIYENLTPNTILLVNDGRIRLQIIEQGKDFLITEQISEFSKTRLINMNDLPKDWQIVDIGPKSISQIQGIIDKSSTIFWNGPMGIFEIKKYSKGTSQIAKTLAKANNKLTVLGGGSTVQAVRNERLDDKFSHISTGGGAFLKFLEGQTLPAIIPITE